MKTIKNSPFSASLKLVMLAVILSSSLASCLVVDRQPTTRVVVIDEGHHDNGRHNGHHKH